MNTDIKSILNSIVLSPSSHNTQPWDIAVDGSVFYFYVNEDRRLKVADPTNRELYASIGCAIANCLVQAEALSYTPHLTYFPNGENDLLVAQVNLKKNTSNISNLSKLADFISSRLSNRGKYLQQKKLPQTFIHQAEKIVQDWDVTFTLISDDSKKERLASLTRSAMIKALENKAFRDELTHWIRHNWTKKEDGMPGFVSGMPGPVSILFPAIVHSPIMPKEVGQSEYTLIRESSAVGILSIQSDKKVLWVKAGIALELVWLLATKEGLAMSLLSGAVEVEEERMKVKKVLETPLLPTVFFRIGYPTQTSRSAPRRKIEGVLIDKKS